MTQILYLISDRSTSFRFKSNGSRLAPHPEEQEPHKRTWPTGSIKHDIDLIDESTTYPQIIRLLVKHNCPDLSDKLQDITRGPVCTSLAMDVYQASLSDGTMLAVKKVRLGEGYSCGDASGKFQKRLAREIYTWSQCDHRNIWPLKGLADFEGQLAIVSVWADRGNLSQYLQKTPEANCCELSLGIATGLAYLHRNDIIHGDLKGPNVLISASGTPMLCDFGNSVIRDAELMFVDSRSGMGNTLRWMAPELLTEATKSPNSATDVYSLGMETFMGRPPYNNLNDRSVILTVCKGMFPARPKEVPVESQYGNILWTVLRSCWSRNPNMRPTVRAVRYILRPMTEDSLCEAPPPEPAHEIQYDDSDKVDYSNEINEEDERQDRPLIKQKERANHASIDEERPTRADYEVDNWEAGEQSVDGAFSWKETRSISSTGSCGPSGSGPTREHKSRRERSMEVLDNFR
ncbi:unnamed protein product, partial [Rhizoctonia solani]